MQPRIERQWFSGRTGIRKGAKCQAWSASGTIRPKRKRDRAFLKVQYTIEFAKLCTLIAPRNYVVDAFHIQIKTRRIRDGLPCVSFTLSPAWIERNSWIDWRAQDKKRWQIRVKIWVYRVSHDAKQRMKMEILDILPILIFSLIVGTRLILEYYFILDSTKRKPCLIRITNSGRLEDLLVKSTSKWCEISR